MSNTEVSRAKSLAQGLTLILVIFLVLEALLRLLNINPKVDNPFFLLVRVYEYPDYFKKDHDLFWKFRENIKEGTEFLVPGSYRINSMGLRGADIDLDQIKSQYRIACFGNSCTFGWKLNEGDTYEMQLEGVMKETPDHHDCRVFNCGVPGYSSFQGLRMMAEYLPSLRPNVVTMCYGWNDQWAGGFDIEDKEQKMAPQWVLDMQNTLSRTFLYRSIKYLLLSRTEKNREYSYNRQSPHYRVSLDDFKANLESMVTLCRSKKVIPILITAPVGDADPGVESPMEIYHAKYNDVTRGVASESKVILVDAAAEFQTHPEFYDDPKGDFIHYNKMGASRIAEMIAAALSKEQP